jgi:phosphoglucosamine mutase
MFPQTLVNVRVAETPDLDSGPVRASIEDVEQQLGERGRVVLRASGTEPVVRVMVEGEDAAEVRTLADQLAQAVGAAAA